MLDKYQTETLPITCSITVYLALMPILILHLKERKIRRIEAT